MTLAKLTEHAMLGELFDPRSEFLIREHCRPHWSQAGAVVFLTFRTQDSIPKEVVRRWDLEKRVWLDRVGADPDLSIPAAVASLSDKDRNNFLKHFNRTRESFLDDCHGACLLKRSEPAKIVADSLLHFDGERYRMGDFVVMPNHVHLLAAFPSAESMRAQCGSWLHFTAVQINRVIGGMGKFWQAEPFDHLVRSPEQYDHLRIYIRENPIRAGLREGEYLYRRFDG